MSYAKHFGDFLLQKIIQEFLNFCSRQVLNFQDLGFSHGKAGTRYEEERRTFDPIDIGDNIKLHMNRCILISAVSCFVLASSMPLPRPSVNKCTQTRRQIWIQYHESLVSSVTRLGDFEFLGNNFSYKSSLNNLVNFMATLKNTAFVQR